MNLKRCNAICGLLATIFLLIHVIYQIAAYLLFLYNPFVTKLLAGLCMAPVLAHAVIGMGILFFGDGSALRDYPVLNRRTILQRGSAIASMVLLCLHTFCYSFLMSGSGFGTAGAFAVQILFFAAVFTHVAVSFGNAFVTLGWVSSPAVKKRLDTVSYVCCGAGFAVSAVVVVKTYFLLLAMH